MHIYVLSGCSCFLSFCIYIWAQGGVFTSLTRIVTAQVIYKVSFFLAHGASMFAAATKKFLKLSSILYIHRANILNLNAFQA